MNMTLFSAQVHLCEAEGLPEFLGEGAPLPDRDGRPVLVAVKQLRADATNNARCVCLYICDHQVCVYEYFL